MKTKQIPDDFREWMEARTFESAAPITLPPRLPMDYLKRTIIRQPAASPPIGESSPLKPMLSAIWKVEMTQRSICLADTFRRFRMFADINPGVIEVGKKSVALERCPRS
jgi:hypothetical protein